jgi:hypothetical protein
MLAAGAVAPVTYAQHLLEQHCGACGPATPELAFDQKALSLEMHADTLPQVALEFDGVV